PEEVPEETPGFLTGLATGIQENAGVLRNVAGVVLLVGVLGIFAYNRGAHKYIRRKIRRMRRY
ncbi:MAG: hypothetical protein ACLFTR_05270, partial [Candidatus Woesearchaeota archaeon]